MQTEQKMSPTIIVPADPEDSAVNSFNEKLKVLIKRSPAEIIINCAKLIRPTSRHIYTIWRAFQDCKESGIAVRLEGVSAQLSRILVATDLFDLLMSPEDDKDSADAACKGEIFVLKSIPEEFCIDFHPDNDAIDLSMNKFKDYLDQLEMPGMLLYDLVTVFYEISTNIGLHSQLEDSEKIHFRAIPALDRIRLDFEYPGIEFDPGTIKTEFNPQKAIIFKQEHGLGLILVRKIVDNIIYNRVNNERNLLTLEKRWN